MHPSVGRDPGGVAMCLFDERALREIVAEEVRRVLREELSERGRPGSYVEFLPVAEAAARVAVAPATIRVWMAQGACVATTPAVSFGSAPPSWPR